MGRLVLASASPRRTELLARVGISFEVAPSEVDERPIAGESPAAYVMRVAEAKAAVAAARFPGRPILAADTTVAAEGVLFGKPEDEADAARMLSALTGRAHDVLTGFVVRTGDGRSASRAVSTMVLMRPLVEGELEGYVAAGEWRGKAGGYAIQGMAAVFITAVRGSITNVVGLPLAEVVDELNRLGIARVDFAAGRSE